ncbi:BQ2448_2540 [Microbotryum intermedium]|uniref:Histone acetyltransferase n=1 Tax=Microbotryum intermedium TaxID=269621 RepID=A0A238F6N5_9BASI|nr:BQ2448_2540 [Microbotryum intermedium]
MGRSSLSTTLQLSTPVPVSAVVHQHRHAPTRSSSLRQSTLAHAAAAASSTPPPAATGTGTTGPTGTIESTSARVDTASALDTPKHTQASTSSSTPRTSKPSAKLRQADVIAADTTSTPATTSTSTTLASKSPVRTSPKSKSKAKAHSQSHLHGLESSPNTVALPPPPRRVGPHGVPFLPPYTPIDTLCAFCGGTKARNRANRAEELVSCYECGSSGHPTCLDWDDTCIVKRVKQYAWLCQECKRCEVCDDKGADADMLFCDSCDRGWHRACQTPPMTSFPRGKWVCPTCKSQAEFADDAPTIVADGARRKIHVVPPKPPLPSSMAIDETPKSERSKRVRRSSSVARGDSVWDDGSWNRAPHSAGAGGGGSSRRHSTTGASARKDRKSKGKGKADDATPSRGFYDPFADNDLVGPRVILPSNNKKRRRDEADWMQQVAYLQRMDELEAEQEAANADPIEHLDLWAGYLRPDQSDTKGRIPNDDDRRRFKRARDEVEVGSKPRWLRWYDRPSADSRDLHSRTSPQARQLRILLAPRPAPVPTLPPAVLPPLQFGTPSHHSPSHFSQMPALNVPDVAYSGVQPVRSHHPPGHDHPGTPIPGMAAIAQSDFDELTIANGIPIANIRAIRFGEFEIETWYQAPFPEEFSRVADGRLWICEFCLKYTKGGFQASRHRLKCKTRHPPGDEIYRDGSVSVFEVDGRKNKVRSLFRVTWFPTRHSETHPFCFVQMYCQNLCLLAKMFLDHKTLYYDVEPFLFYIMTTAGVTGAKFVGYFSKEKRSPTNNVSCIMTLPVRQRRGWGNLLIDFSYLLSKKEGRVGTPERPLSELGLLSYRNYWTLTVCQYLNAIPESQTVTIQDISEKTAMTPDDIYFVLKEQGWIVETSKLPSPELIPATTGAEGETAEGAASQLQRRKSRVGGAGGSLSTGPKPSSSRQGYVDDPHLLPTVKVPEHYRLIWDRQHVAQHVQKWERKNHLRLKPDKLQWSPFLVTRGFGLDANVGSTAKDGTAQIRPNANGDTNASPARTTINVGALANALGAQWDDDSGSSHDPGEASAVAGPSNASRSLATSDLINGAPRAMAEAAAMNLSKATSEADAQSGLDEDEEDEDRGGEGSSAADSTFQVDKEEDEEEEDEEDEDRARRHDNTSSDESGPSLQVATPPRRPRRGSRASEPVKVPERRELRSRVSTGAALPPADGSKRLTRQSLSVAKLATPLNVKTPKGSNNDGPVKTNGHQRKVSTSTTGTRQDPSSSPRMTRKGPASREVKISPELGRSTATSGRRRREVSTVSARTSEATGEETSDTAMAVAPTQNGKTRPSKEKVGKKEETMTTCVDESEEESEEEDSDEEGDDDVVAGMVGLNT